MIQDRDPGDESSPRTGIYSFESVHMIDDPTPEPEMWKVIERKVGQRLMTILADGKPSVVRLVRRMKEEPAGFGELSHMRRRITAHVVLADPEDCQVGDTVQAYAFPHEPHPTFTRVFWRRYWRPSHALAAQRLRMEAHRMRPHYGSLGPPDSIPLPSRRQRIQAMIGEKNRLYRITRRGPGDVVALVNALPLRHYPRHADGFEYGYEGSGPADLSYALLADALDGGAMAMDVAERNHQRYKRAVVAIQKADFWEVTRRMILHWLLDHGRLNEEDEHDHA